MLVTLAEPQDYPGFLNGGKRHRVTLYRLSVPTALQAIIALRNHGPIYRQHFDN